MSFPRVLSIAGSACLVLVTVSIVSLAWSSDRPGVANKMRAAQLEEKFHQLDRNGDQKLSESELGPGLFAFLNLNADDHVTLDEAKEAIQAKGYDELQKVANTVDGSNPPTTTSLEEIRQGPSRLVPGDNGIGGMIADAELTDINGAKFRLSDFNNKTALVIAITNTSCPICKKYTPSLAAIEDQYASKNVAFVYVNPTASDKLDVIRSVVATNQLDGHYVRDEQGALAKSLGATHTTDVFVLDAKRTLVYRGAVDDQYGFGYSIDEPKVTYLRNAIDAVLVAEPVRIAATTAPGCPLELSESDTTQSESNELTYHNRISRIVQNHCVDCHRDGGVGPFSLQDYDSVVSQAGAIRRVVKDNLMPPWFAVKSDEEAVSPFINDCSLSKRDKADLLSWLNGGKVEGDLDDAPVPRTFVTDWQIGEPDVVWQLPSPMAVKASGTMPYQNVIVETGLTEDRYVKAIEVRPTAREVVHHCLVFVLPPADRKSRTREDRQGDDERDGFFAAYAPGYDALVFNEGYGKVIPAGSRLKFQLHYTPNGTATFDQSMIGIVFADKRPDHLVNVAGISQPRLAIPPHADNFEVNASIKLPSDATVLAFFPHMHLRGKAFKYEATLPDGKTQTLLDIPRYDFNWQLSYRLAEPLRLPAGTTIRATGWFDNSANNPANPDPNRTVPWGPQTYDEMMIGYVEYHMENDKIDRFASLPNIAAIRNLGSGKNIEAIFKVLDKNGDGKLSSEELPAAQRDNLLRLDLNRDGVISWKEAEQLSTLLKRKP